MQQKLPCSLCRKAFYEKAIVAFHRWFLGEERLCYKQRMCMKCWRQHYQLMIAASTNQDDYEAPEPVDCHGCGNVLGEDATDTFTTWYRGQQRRDTLVKECPHCAAGLRTIMMTGSDRQEERPLAGVGTGGAPLPNPPAFGRDDLPW